MQWWVQVVIVNIFYLLHNLLLRFWSDPLVLVTHSVITSWLPGLLDETQTFGRNYLSPTTCLTERDVCNMKGNPPLLGKGSSLVGKNNLEPWFMHHCLVVRPDRWEHGCWDTFRVLPTTKRRHPDYQMISPFSGPGTALNTCRKLWALCRKKFFDATDRCTRPVCILTLMPTTLWGLQKAKVKNWGLGTPG